MRDKRHQKGHKVRMSYFKTQWGDFRQPGNSSQPNKAEWLKVICFPGSGRPDWTAAVPPTNTQGGVGKKKNMRGQNEAVKQPLAILQKGGWRVRGCLEIVPSVWGVWVIKVKETNFFFFFFKKKRGKKILFQDLLQC